MAETKEKDHLQALDQPHQKRKPDLDCVEEGEKNESDNNNKKKKIVEEEEEEDLEREIVRSVYKGKGKMIMEEEVEEENGDGDDDSDSDSGIAVGGGNDDGDGAESDFEDDPLAEVDLDNILPSRTRRRAPPVPGAYLVTDQDSDDEDDEDADGYD